MVPWLTEEQGKPNFMFASMKTHKGKIGLFCRGEIVLTTKQVPKGSKHSSWPCSHALEEAHIQNLHLEQAPDPTRTERQDEELCTTCPARQCWGCHLDMTKPLGAPQGREPNTRLRRERGGTPLPSTAPGSSPDTTN